MGDWAGLPIEAEEAEAKSQAPSFRRCTSGRSSVSDLSSLTRVVDDVEAARSAGIPVHIFSGKRSFAFGRIGDGAILASSVACVGNMIVAGVTSAAGPVRSAPELRIAAKAKSP